jgi:hypothetical protein
MASVGPLSAVLSASARRPRRRRVPSLARPSDAGLRNERSAIGSRIARRCESSAARTRQPSRVRTRRLRGTR